MFACSHRSIQKFTKQATKPKIYTRKTYTEIDQSLSSVCNSDSNTGLRLVEFPSHALATPTLNTTELDTTHDWTHANAGHGLNPQSVQFPPHQFLDSRIEDGHKGTIKGREYTCILNGSILNSLCLIQTQ